MKHFDPLSISVNIFFYEKKFTVALNKRDNYVVQLKFRSVKYVVNNKNISDVGHLSMLLNYFME